MGVSSDGILVFGFEIESDEYGDGGYPDFLIDTNGDDSTIDFDDFVLEKAGYDGHGCDYDAKRKVIEACPADLTMHCSYDFPMYILAVRGTEIRASRGHPTKITQEQLSISQERIDAFKKWCVSVGILHQEPEWILCSMYG